MKAAQIFVLPLVQLRWLLTLRDEKPIVKIAPLLLFAALIAIPAAQAKAAEFLIPKLSAAYSARMVVEQCEDGACSGPAKIELLDAKTGGIIQRFESQDMTVSLNADSKPGINDSTLYSDQSALIVDDFNFDGQSDLAIRNCNNSAYGGPSYDVYVYNITHKAFVLSDDLTSLASSALGMFQVDHQRKRLETLEKSGCCWHRTTQYAVVPRQGLQQVYTKEEAMTADGKQVIVTVRQRLQGRWKTSTRRYNTGEYYKR